MPPAVVKAHVWIIPPASDGADASAEAAHIDWYIAVGGAIVAQFAIEVPSPTFDTACRGQGTRVIATVLTPLLKPLTATGTLLWAVLSVPSSPKALLPQHLTPPDVVKAHV